MIIESILDLFLVPLLTLVANLPILSTISIPDGIFNSFNAWLGMASHILPVNTVVQLWTIKLSILAFSIAWSLILRIKSFIPTMGN